jgi:adenine phosphoribosyltransferase
LTERNPLGDSMLNSSPGDETDFARLIRVVPDFPEPGILFRDLTPLLASPRAFQEVIHRLASTFLGEKLDVIVAIEARGFIFGSALASRLNLGFVPVRKPGKLPYQTARTSYALEYGKAELEIHNDALEPGAKVLVVDDVLATGGTAEATARLVHELGARVVAYAFVIELTALGGRKRLVDFAPSTVCSLVNYA